MAEIVGAVLAWLVPALIVFGVTAILVAVVVWAARRARRSPRARAAAEQDRARAGATLVRLDDEVAELDLEVGLSGALYGGGAPASLRRARLNGQHVRDQSFDEYRAISEPGVAPDEIRRLAARIDKRSAEALRTIAAARSEHAAWVQANISAAGQIAAARERLAGLRASMGDPAALVSELAARFDEDEWQDAARAARDALHEADEAARRLDAAAAHAQDPTRSVLAELGGAERSLRQAEADARILEEAHRLVLQAAQAVPGEVDAARVALHQAHVTREHLDPADAEKLGAELRAIDAELTAIEADAARRPSRTVDRIARLRSRLDLALGDARTAQQRLRGARTALPGTLAAARGAIAQAEASVAHSRASADARSRMLSAQHELAQARQAGDPVAALDAARRALRHAEDAMALADYDRLGRP
ncbi:coiled-coil domain-containing protein [Microbacterium sp. HJ5]